MVVSLYKFNYNVQMMSEDNDGRGSRVESQRV